MPYKKPENAKKIGEIHIDIYEGGAIVPCMSGKVPPQAITASKPAIRFAYHAHIRNVNNGNKANVVEAQRVAAVKDAGEVKKQADISKEREEARVLLAEEKVTLLATLEELEHVDIKELDLPARKEVGANKQKANARIKEIEKELDDAQAN